MLKNYEKDKICCINREIIVNQEVDKSNNEIERFKINSIISKKIDNPLSFETKDNFNNSTHKILSSGLFYFIKDDGLFEQLN